MTSKDSEGNNIHNYGQIIKRNNKSNKRRKSYQIEAIYTINKWLVWFLAFRGSSLLFPIYL